MCALSCGVAERQLELLAEYTTRRQQFDRPIASFQAVAHRAADAYIAVEAIKLVTWQAAWRLDAGRTALREVALAKYWAAEAGQAVANAAQHLHGGMGFDRGYPLFRYYLWAKNLELGLGGAAVHLSRLGALFSEKSAPDIKEGLR
jgi:alkylation response protein AidB-like acyl-CoA dehydrogenase